MVKAWREKVVIPTYEVGSPEKNPIFLEKRVYQGSSGVVYPYPVIESIADEKTDKEYEVVFIENEYIKVMILPELGGRVQMAYDKIRQRHFIYYNHVIKPALVGLAGPWISGGIEFNWPQHHRPSTYMPVDTAIEHNSDGSVTVWVSEMERMFHQKGMAGFTLRPGHAYLEIKGAVYNRTDVPQTFLWWANPAVAVNDHYQSVFPPDINAVFDHGKRAVSSFPIATGTYYKMDYSAGVDISNYKNIFVPTSYMAVNSKYDFEGGYENDTKAGVLHVANHHISPGKKQWTWGNGDFGRAWDRNLTDTDGPYIELMAGVYTENQPDFTWLQPYEEKSFVQYFLPYRELGVVKNATKDLLMNIDQDGKSGKVNFKIFATSEQHVCVELRNDDGTVYYSKEVTITPENIMEENVDVKGAKLSQLNLSITAGGRTLLTWHSEPDEVRPIPDAAEAALLPEEIKTTEQLYLTGLHLEQYRHATYNPVDYYEEALKLIEESLGIDRFNYGCLFEKYIITGDDDTLQLLKTMMRRCANNYDEIALDYCAAGCTCEALKLWSIAIEEGALTPMTYYYMGWCNAATDAEAAKELFAKAEAYPSDYCFPNRLEAVLALNCAMAYLPQASKAPYYLGCLYYDKRQYDLAIKAWERSAAADDKFPTVWRNLALAAFNKQGDKDKAVRLMEKAFALDNTDARVLMELDQLYKCVRRPHAERLALLRKYGNLVARRDDLLLEEITLLNQTGQYEEAKAKLDAHIFHPWEGGEGKVPAQYQFARVELAKKAIAEGRHADAVSLLEECLTYPHHLGEGKLHGAQENDFYYLMGVAYDAMGQTDKARQCWLKATEGPTEPAAALYYNDAKPDKIFYQGMALLKLGRTGEANGRFHKLVNYGEKHLFDKVRMDYFAVSLPDLLIWEDDLQVRNEIHCKYMMALGYCGLGNKDKSMRYLGEAEALDINHQGIQAFKTL